MTKAAATALMMAALMAGVGQAAAQTPDAQHAATPDATNSAPAVVSPPSTETPAPVVAPTPQTNEPTTQAATPAAPTAAPPEGPSTIDLVNNAKLTDKPTGKGGVSPAILRAEVMLDRLHDSPGVIDGKDGTNFVHALEAFESERDMKPAKTLDETNWAALLRESGGPVLEDYTLTDKDVAGPFFPDLPKDYAKLAKLKSMGYRNVAQKVGAKFHMGEDLLGALNPGLDLSKAGTKIAVTHLDPMQPIRDKLKYIIVDKAKSQVFGFDAKHHIIIAVPATIGSRELPSPSGTYKVRGIAWNPIYYYDPKNFVQGDNHEKLKLPPGPNNPVGSVFMALTKPTYGLHGTPDPSEIDKTASHGCVRMTNWDATEFAHLVRRGIVVSFKK